MEQPIEKEPECKTITQYILYKLDRSLAILGVVGIAFAAIIYYKGADGVQIVSAAVGGLVVYIGGRGGK